MIYCISDGRNFEFYYTIKEVNVRFKNIMKDILESYTPGLFNFSHMKAYV